MKKFVFTLLILIGINLITNAQNELHFSHIGRENGFPLDKANTITQDKKGFIWIGTWNGLSKYDGYNCTNFLPQYHDSTSISNREITSLLTDSNGDIWAGTSNGLNYINAETNRIKIYPFKSRILALCEDYAKNIWVGTSGDGLYKLNRTTGEITPFLSGETINDIHEDKYHNLWVATNYGLVLLDKNRVNRKRYIREANKNSLSNSSVIQVVSSNNGYLWIATWGGGLNRAELNSDGTLTNFTHYLPGDKPNSICSNVIFRLAYDKFNNLWVGSWSQGLSLLNIDQQSLPAKDANFYTYQNDPLNHNSISSNDISSLFVDQSNNLWVGASKIDRAQIVGKGINRYVLPRLKDNNALHIKCFAKLNNKLWVGANQYIFEYEKVNQSYVFKKQYIPTNHIPKGELNPTCNILDMYADDKGLWVGTDGSGLIFYPIKSTEIKASAAKVYNTKTTIAIPNNRVCKILPSKANPNSLWIGTAEYGISHVYINSNGAVSAKSFSTSNGMSSNAVRALLEDDKANLWIGTLNGLNYLNTRNNTFSHYFYSIRNEHSINDNIINSIFEDSDNNIWIGTNSGLNKMISLDNKVAFKGYSKTDYLSNELIFNIKEDASRNLWIRTYNGVLKLNPHTENIDDKFFRQDFENTRLEKNANITISNNSFIIGNDANFITFNPSIISSKQDFNKTVVTNILIFNKSTNNTSDTIKLSYLDQMITFRFSDMSYLAPEEVTYSYKLKGFDKQWNKIKRNNMATYTNIPPGDYTFSITSDDTITNKNTTNLFLSIAPPWWKSNFAFALYFLLIVAFIYGLNKYRINKEEARRQRSLEKMKAEELERLNEQKSLFFTDITHELRTPLTLILEPSRELASDSSLKAENKEKVRLIKTSADKLLRLVNKLMEFRKLENNITNTLIYSYVDLNQMVGEVFTFFKPLAHSRNIDFSIHAQSENILIYLDIDKFEKVIFNIISNAFKYTPNKGKISVNITNNEQYAEIEVSDNGIGIAEKYQDKVFERFFQINQIQTQSTGGVGLYMAKELINLHRGEIKLKSQENNGSSFTITLPLAPDNKEELNSEIKTYHLVENNSISYHDEGISLNGTKAEKILKILVVEDDIELNKFIITNLTKGFEVEKAMNGKEALEVLNHFTPDLIISDVLMPEMGGFQLAETLHKSKLWKSIPIIFLTAKSSSEDEIKGLKLGAVDYINKPFNMTLLQIKIQNILSNRKKEKEGIRTTHLLTPEEIKLPSADEIFLKKAVEVTHKNLDNPNYDVELFSSDMNMSQNQLYRRLKSLTGQTAKEFIRSQRLKVAADLLSKQKRSVSEVIYLVGFSSPSYFSRCFKDAYGCSPTEYTRKNKNDNRE
ncbi:MAG: two-component regulator propeller domain-containing protein [Mangrovibacterium sp.]